MNTRNIYFALIIMVALILSACETRNPIDSSIDRPEVISESSTITIPANVTITGAVLELGCFLAPHSSSKGYAKYDVFKSAKSWDESATWNSFMPGIGGWVSEYEGVEGNISIPLPVALIKGWADGSIPNNGLVLKQRESLYDGGNYSKYNSSEGNPLKPTLTVYFSDGTLSKSVATQDTYINENSPNSVPEDENLIAVGFLYQNSLKRKPGLVQFDFEVLPPEEPGCSLTPGYWKTHADPTKKKFDATWNLLPNGTATPFFVSGLTYLAILDSPTKGNPYVILAHAYIAAELNFLNGSDPSAAQAAFVTATGLLTGANPADVKQLKGDAKAIWIDTAAILDNYNNGDIGPGHCD